MNRAETTAVEHGKASLAQLEQSEFHRRISHGIAQIKINLRNRECFFNYFQVLWHFFSALEALETAVFRVEMVWRWNAFLRPFDAPRISCILEKSLDEKMQSTVQQIAGILAVVVWFSFLMKNEKSSITGESSHGKVTDRVELGWPDNGFEFGDS